MLWLGRATFGLAVAALAVWYLDWARLGEVLTRIDPIWFAVACALNILAIAFLCVRWILIVKPYARTTIRQHIGIYGYAALMNSFTPANMGGDIYRALAFRNRGDGLAGVVLALFRERIIGLQTYFLAYLIGLGGLFWFATSLDAVPFQLLYAAAPIFLLVIVVAALQPLLPRLRGLPMAGRSMRLIAMLKRLETLSAKQEGASLMPIALCSALGYIGWIAAVMVVAIDLEVQLSILYLGTIAALAELIRNIPLSIQGIGIRESTYAYLIVIGGGQAETGFLLGLVIYAAASLCLLLIGLAGWLILLADSKR